MKMTPQHTHPNPKKGKNEPLFITIPGFSCPDCPKKKKGK